MQNLPQSYQQKDRELYQTISLEGSLNYESLYMSGKAKDEAGNVRGIPADDFNIFATLVFALKDRRSAFSRLRKGGQAVRHIDSGTGPNLYTFIASLPYADELVSIDLTPANVHRLEAFVTGSQPLAPHWQAWLELAELLYDIGSAENLMKLDRTHPDYYDQLRHYPNHTAPQRQALYNHVLQVLRRQPLARNPYKAINLERELTKKLRPHTGDILDDTAPLAHLVGTADIYTRVFFSESIDDTLVVVAHAEVNGIQFAKEGAFTLSAHMSKTTGYKGFFTPKELEEDPGKRLAELPATPSFFELLLGELVVPTQKYRILWEALANTTEERKMVRQGILYGGAVIICGNTNYKNPDGSNKFENGLELITSLRHALRIVTSDDHILHCTTRDVGSAVSELSAMVLGDDTTEKLDVRVAVPGPSST